MQYGVSLIMLDNEGEVASRLWGTRSPRESIFSFEKLTECYQNQAASSQLLTSAVRVYWLVSASGASTKKMRVEGGGGGNNQKTGKKSHIGSTTTPYFDYYSCQVIAWVMLPLAPSSPSQECCCFSHGHGAPAPQDEEAASAAAATAGGHDVRDEIFEIAQPSDWKIEAATPPPGKA
eukprot:1158702-Pelagomonas_calceolata.AAC.24